MTTGLLLVIAVALIWIWVDMPKSESMGEDFGYLTDVCPPSWRERIFFVALKVSIVSVFALIGWGLVMLI